MTDDRERIAGIIQDNSGWKYARNYKRYQESDTAVNLLTDKILELLARRIDLEKCPECNGEKFVIRKWPDNLTEFDQPCFRCKGTGSVPLVHAIDLGKLSALSPQEQTDVAMKLPKWRSTVEYIDKLSEAISQATLSSVKEQLEEMLK